VKPTDPSPAVRPDRPDTDANHRDRGAALVVAVAFVLMIGTIMAGLTSMVTSGLDNRIALEELRDRQYAADGAVEAAIASTRAAIDRDEVRCDDVTTSTATVNGVAVRVETLVICDTAVGSTGLPITQVSSVYTACGDRGTACTEDDVILRALVGFEVGGDGAVVHVPVHSWSVSR
jgi:Tfp pilus assembly protein PilX